uniref:Uncharacterized protein n=2 Tax=Aegilops tauschii subsp. strangulata TaxID=200361 RepID=A0A453LPQ0_AEGTS
MACAATAPFAGGVAMEADGGLEFLLDPVDRFPLREESADNLEHPDPVPLALLPRREIRGRKNASPTRSPQSTGEVNHEAPGWTKGKPEVKNSRSCRCSDKTSLYDMPFGLFVRVNHHFQSVILVGVRRIS